MDVFELSQDRQVNTRQIQSRYGSSTLVFDLFLIQFVEVLL